MTRLLATLAALLLAASCADDRPRQHATNATTPGGVRVFYPEWLFDLSRQQAEQEIDAAGVPPGWVVVVTVPIFAAPSSPTGLARGTCDYDRRTITVGWRARPWETFPCLPALGHEVQHAVTGDPLAGH